MSLPKNKNPLTQKKTLIEEIKGKKRKGIRHTENE